MADKTLDAEDLAKRINKEMKGIRNRFDLILQTNFLLKLIFKKPRRIKLLTLLKTTRALKDLK